VQNVFLYNPQLSHNTYRKTDRQKTTMPRTPYSVAVARQKLNHEADFGRVIDHDITLLHADG